MRTWTLTAAIAISCVLLLQGCAYPRVVKYYDEECQIMAKRMELDATEIPVAQSCTNEGCLLSLMTSAVISATSLVVSGSVVYVGNVIYWKERNKNCKRGEPYVPSETPRPPEQAASSPA
jgi:hypothetical protein